MALWSWSRRFSGVKVKNAKGGRVGGGISPLQQTQNLKWAANLTRAGWQNGPGGLTESVI